MISENFGVALGPEPEIIPFLGVKAQLEALKARNGGKPTPVLRNGMIVRVASGDFAGIWRIRSCKNDASKGLLMDLTFPDRCPAAVAKVDWSKREVRVRTLLKGGITICDEGLCGIASCIT